jgi:membrane fusion protein (multidrug efflux system)
MFKIMPLIYQAEMQKSQAEADFAKIEYLNTKRLADSNIVSQNELALAQAEYDKAKAVLSLSQVHLGFTEIRAPFDGITGRFYEVRLGSLIDEGELLTTLSDNSKMWVYFNVPEAEYLYYATHKNKDTLLKVKLEMANNKLFSHIGVVETIEADFNNETGNIAFRATFPNPDKLLRHGETGNILIPTVLEDALIIPQKATFEILDKKYVYVVDEKGNLKTRKITIAEEMEHFYAISAGLQENDKILLEGLRKVKDSEHIKFSMVSHQEVIKDLKRMRAE